MVSMCRLPYSSCSEDGIAVAHSHLHFLPRCQTKLGGSPGLDRTRHSLPRLTIYNYAALLFRLFESTTKMPKIKRKVMAKSKPLAKSKSKPRTKANPPAKAKAAAKRTTKSEPVFFYDAETSSEGAFLSPWWRSCLEVKGVEYQSAGQYIMAEKARAFGDKVSIHEEQSLDEMMN